MPGVRGDGPGPPRLAVREGARGNRYAPEFAVEVAIQKYLDHLPLDRQVRIMRREGLDIDSQALARVLEPSYDGLRHHVLRSELVGAYESWWRLMERKASQRWWAWGLSREDAVVYRVLDSCSQEAARQLLYGYRGIVMADGYGAHDALSRASPGFTLVHCWAHVRRKFVEAEPHYPGPCPEVLELIGELFAIEREVPSLNGLSEEAWEEALRLRARLRADRSRPILRHIRDWALGQRALPDSSLGKAIAYTLGLWENLTRFLDDPRIPLDNNQTERGLRSVVLGRKNHNGSRSKRGTEVAALSYSLIESAKLCGVDPKAYLLQATRAALADRAAVTLPHDLLQYMSSGNRLARTGVGRGVTNDSGPAWPFSRCGRATLFAVLV